MRGHVSGSYTRATTHQRKLKNFCKNALAQSHCLHQTISRHHTLKISTPRISRDPNHFAQRPPDRTDTKTYGATQVLLDSTHQIIPRREHRTALTRKLAAQLCCLRMQETDSTNQVCISRFSSSKLCGSVWTNVWAESLLQLLISITESLSKRGRRHFCHCIGRRQHTSLAATHTHTHTCRVHRQIQRVHHTCINRHREFAMAYKNNTLRGHVLALK